MSKEIVPKSKITKRITYIIYEYINHAKSKQLIAFIFQFKVDKGVP